MSDTNDSEGRKPAAKASSRTPAEKQEATGTRAKSSSGASKTTAGKASSSATRSGTAGRRPSSARSREERPTPVRRTAPKHPYFAQMLTVAVLASFLLAYGYAQSNAASKASIAAQLPNGATISDTGVIQAGSNGGGAPVGGGCCGGGGAPIEGKTTVSGKVQKITVDMSSGSYNPNTIIAKAGVPVEITFGQSAGCTAQIQFPGFNILEDLTGGAKTIKLPALQKGEYPFYCGMQMVSGKLVVQ